MRTDTRRAVLSEINVTPFVDVMLVLLIIFMVTAPLLQQGIKVTLPRAITSQKVSGAGTGGAVISLTRDHLVYFNEELVTLQELRQKLSHLKTSDTILIQADRYSYVNKLIELWDLCRQVGLREVHIATLPD